MSISRIHQVLRGCCLSFLVITAVSARADYIFVSECQINTIMRYDSSGNGAVFADASDGLIDPAGIKCDGQGNLYVAENMKVLKFDPNGSVSQFGPNFAA